MARFKPCHSIKRRRYNQGYDKTERKLFVFDTAKKAVLL